jgi:hypothetical protein
MVRSSLKQNWGSWGLTLPARGVPAQAVFDAFGRIDEFLG